MKRLLFLLLSLSLLLSVGCQSEQAQLEKRTIVIGEGDWDSNAFHNQVIAYIIKHGYNQTTEIVTADTSVLIASMKSQDIDLSVELWSDNVPTYAEDIKNDVYRELSVNFDDNNQGLYVPIYLVDGDEAPAKNLKTVKDLKKYKDLFPDPEDPSRGIIYGGPEGWKATEFLHNKMKVYGLDKDYNFKPIDSNATLSATLTSAYEKKEAWVGYNWEPTWIMGLYQMVLLADDPYSTENWEKGIGAFPQVRVTVIAIPEFIDEFPDVADFLTHYQTSSALTSEALAYMQKNEAEADQAAIWFLKQHPELWQKWVPETVATKVQNSLDGKANDNNSRRFFAFPENLRFEISQPIDRFVNWLVVNLSGFFNFIRKVILAIFDGVGFVLGIIPWWLLIIALFIVSYKLYNLKMAFGLSLMLFVIGLFGLWDMMLYTLTIVIISVLVSLLLGLPLGILMAKSDIYRRISMPLLDGMQTMPSFVYLIPAVMFFGFGKVPAVIATITYALPPLIRLTYLGITSVNKEVIEAGLSFGSTSKQMLRKIELPQALSTIMTGINQTTMMAMAMVVISSMIGAEGIGNEVLVSIRRLKIGNGFQAGLAIVFLAIILDRVLQGFAKNLKEKE